MCSQPAVAPRAAGTPTDRSNGRPIQPRLTDRAAGVKTEPTRPSLNGRHPAATVEAMPLDEMREISGGGRATIGMADVYLPPKFESKDLIGKDLEMVFRRLGSGGQVHNYYWRCKPLREYTLAAPAAKETK